MRRFDGLALLAAAALGAPGPGCAASRAPDAVAAIGPQHPPPFVDPDDARHRAPPAATAARATGLAPRRLVVPPAPPNPLGALGALVVGPQSGPTLCPVPSPSLCAEALCRVTRPPLGTNRQDLALCLPSGSWVCDPAHCTDSSSGPGQHEVQLDHDGVVVGVADAEDPGAMEALRKQVEDVAGPPTSTGTQSFEWTGRQAFCRLEMIGGLAALICILRR